MHIQHGPCFGLLFVFWATPDFAFLNVLSVSPTTRCEWPKGGGRDFGGRSPPRGGGGGFGGGGGGRGGRGGEEFKVTVENIPRGGSWQDLKDFCRDGGFSDVAYTDVQGSEGVIKFRTEDEAERAVKDLDDTTFKSHQVSACVYTLLPRPYLPGGVSF